MSANDVFKMMKEKEVQFVDLRFTDTLGKEQHVSVPTKIADAELFEEGKMFDGSSISGWKGIQESDMVLMPDTETAIIDPFTDEVTLNLRCDVLEPATMTGYERCPRSLSRRAVAYMQSTGIAEDVFFGPEPEFFIFDSVTWHDDMEGASYRIRSDEAHWSRGRNHDSEEGNMGHRPGVKGGYFPVPPVDSLNDIRAAMCLAMEEMGIEVEVHHHEVATAGQCEIGTRFGSLVRKADETQILKYCVHNVAHAYHKTATFMPKPLVGDNGSGMHCHQSLSKGGKNLFSGDKYAGLSQEALWYIGGIFKHARALNAFTNAGTNGYKRLVKGFEAPTLLAYSGRNRSASVRIPHTGAAGRRVEVRFPDASGNPYLMFSAMLLAGLDGIQNRIDPGEPMDKDLYDLPPEEEANIKTVCNTLEQALESLDADRDFLKAGGVFSDDYIDAYIKLKEAEVTRFLMTTHPVEFDMYYSL